MPAQPPIGATPYQISIAVECRAMAGNGKWLGRYLGDMSRSALQKQELREFALFHAGIDAMTS